MSQHQPKSLALLHVRRTVLMVAALATAGIVATSSPVSAAIVCNPGGDICTVVPDVVQTPVGLVTVTVGPGNVVTVELAPSTPNTLVIGLPSLPPGPPCTPAYCRTSVTTSAGVVSIDTIVIPPGPPARFTLPNVAIVSIHPPSPCRVRTVGNTVTFTPIVPPGPPA